MAGLALLGGDACVKSPIAPFRTVGTRERELVSEVMEGGLLSGFYGSWGDEFFGGPFVRRFEEQWSSHFRCKHSVSVNSNTSGIMAAAGAIGLSPGDEVIVPPYTMSATAIAPMFYGAIPVFADIEPETFCLDVEKVRRAITPRTRAIFVTNLFGHPAKLKELKALADSHGIYLVEDNAQGPLAKENGRYAGTIGHIGIFSLNVHKHIQTGEGGMCVTDDDDLAMRMRAIRNHGENVVADAGLANIVNTVGLNLRMTELTAAVGIAQLERAEEIVGERISNAERLTAATRGLPLRAPEVRPDCVHVYYTWSIVFDPAELGVSRALLVRALRAEGLPLAEGYVPPLYRLPAFQQRLGIGRDGFPFNLQDRPYTDVRCPVTEELHDSTLAFYENCGHSPTTEQLTQMGDALAKVFSGIDQLRKLEDAA